MRNFARAACAVIAATTLPLAIAAPAVGQDPHTAHAAQAPDNQPAPAHDEMMMGPLNIPLMRDGSGTSWLPDRTPMRAVHSQAGAWTLMFHGNGFVQYISDGGSRGDEQFGSINWMMAMAHRKAGRGDLTLRGMFSLEAWTVGNCGYPDLLATGESCHNGRAIHDRQHPHDLFMELAAQYRNEISGALGYEVYAAPVGEPALGPVAFPHRPSAMTNAIAPISHHWLDATHISFGVVSGGLFGRHWKAETSLFNGREPDETRYDFDFAQLDSYAGRFWWLPTERWALQVSAGRLADVEQQQTGGPFEAVNRTTVSATYHRPAAGMDVWASTVAWGRNADDEGATHALLAETNVPMSMRDAIFGRFEWNQKTAVDLVLPITDPTLTYDLSKASAGYTRDIYRIGALTAGAGGSVSVSVVPNSLRTQYDRRDVIGWAVFLSLRPAAMSMNMPHPAP